MVAHEGVDVHPDHLQAIVDLVEKQESVSNVVDDGSNNSSSGGDVSNKD